MAKGTRGGQHQPPSSAWITRERRIAIYMRDNFSCVYCNADLSQVEASERTLDHLISLAVYNEMDNETKTWFGSAHKTSNVATCCKTCNSTRQDRESWQAFAAKFGVDALSRIYAIVKDNNRLDIDGAKWLVGNNRKNYANCWKPVNHTRLSQGIGTI